ncbi:MAG: hypothetical protein ACRD19_03885 [Terriglobia bacterium]
MPPDPNPAKAQPGWPPVVVAGVYQTGVNLMRDLIRRGLTAYGIDHNRNQPGFRSVYGKTLQCPNPDEKPAEWVDFMSDLARKLGTKPALIPSADAFVSAMARHRDTLKQSYLFCHDASTIQAKLATKEEQYNLVRDHFMPAPRTQFVKSPDEITQFTSVAQFPCLLKPLRTRDWDHLRDGHPFYNKKVALANSAEELAAQYRLAAEINPEVVVQEIIQGPDTAKLIYFSCYNREGSRIAVSMARELRTSPMQFGPATVVEPVWDSETDRVCDQFLKRIGYAGLCEIELKRDSRDGKVKIIEANPRYTGSGDFAHYAGVDLGWLHYLDLIGQAVAPVSQRARNFRHIVLMQDFGAIRSYRRAGLLTWGDFIRAYRPPVVFFDFDFRDWRVTARTVSTLIRLIIGPSIRKVFPKKTRL